jgi:hypothetical protein
MGDDIVVIGDGIKGAIQIEHTVPGVSRPFSASSCTFVLKVAAQATVASTGPATLTAPRSFSKSH